MMGYHHTTGNPEKSSVLSVRLVGLPVAAQEAHQAITY